MEKGEVGKVEKEITAAYGVTPEDGESYQDFHKRLAKAVDADDKKGGDKWDGLSEAAQAFMNDAAALIKKGEDVPPFPGSKNGKPAKAKAKDAEDEDEDDDTAEDKKGGDKPKKEGDVKKAKKEAVAKPKDKGKPATGKDKGKPAKGDKTAKKASGASKANSKEKGKSATMRIWELMFQNPNKTSEDIAAALKKEGFKASDTTVVAYRHEFLRYLRFTTGKGVKGLPKVEGEKDKKVKKSATLSILNAVFAKPDKSSEDIHAQVKKDFKDIQVSTVSTFRIGLLRWMRLMQSKGVKGLPKLD